jgi:hypothetical protein
MAHTNLMRWVLKLLLTFEQRWRKYARPVGRSCRVDETTIKVKGRWVYLYRAVDAAPTADSALTHLGEDDVSAPLLMAKSRHRDLRTLSRYVRPGSEAVAQLTAEHDRAAWQVSATIAPFHRRDRPIAEKYPNLVPLLLGPQVLQRSVGGIDASLKRSSLLSLRNR